MGLICIICQSLVRLDHVGANLKVKGYQREHQRLQVLNEVVEHAQSLRILRLRDIDKRSNLGCLMNLSIRFVPL